MNRGDLVRLKAPEQGRYCEGKIIKEINGCYQVGLPNGLYIVKPIELWELCKEYSDNNFETDRTESQEL